MSTFTVNCDTPGAQIYYESTANGNVASDPTLSSTPYEGRTSCGGLSSLKVRAFKEGWEESEVAEIKGHRVEISGDGSDLATKAIEASGIGDYELEGARLYFPSHTGSSIGVTWTAYDTSGSKIPLNMIESAISIPGWTVVDVYEMPSYNIRLQVKVSDR